MSKIVIIGAGNVATVLGRKISAVGHEIVQVISRNEENTALLAAELHCPWSTDLRAICREADLYLVAIADSNLPSLGKDLSLPGKLVVHTAGAVSKDVLQSVSEYFGVLYPLQSLRKEILGSPVIPFLVDANNPGSQTWLYDFAATLSGRVQVAGDSTRLRVHLGAVLVNNFSNHLYKLAENFCKSEKIDFSLLLPLIKEGAERLSYFSPSETQTGPAIRGDSATIETHRKLLDDYPDIRQLYDLFTDQLQGSSGKS
jgi:predicted short-subunit dehydrogenase-like oxidoreductase (DUF2520 family)